MADKIYKEENTIVVEQGVKVFNFPIADTYFYYNESTETYVIQGNVTKKTCSILKSDIDLSKYENDSAVAYTDATFNAFFRKYASLTGLVIV
jgi:hypothetical protein